MLRERFARAGSHRDPSGPAAGNGRIATRNPHAVRHRILIVEDAEDLAEGLRENLEMEGHEAAVAHDGDRALELVESFSPHLIILDLMLPGTGGFEVLGRLRARGRDVPVLVLSARSEQVDKLRGFRLGADDYVTKPFDLFELLARVDAILRRSFDEGDGGETIAFGDVVLDPRARKAYRGGVEVELTPKEFDLVVTLARRPGRAVSREELLREVWNHKARVRTRTVDTHILQVRRKLEPDPASPRHFLTVSRMGYRFEP
jgi:DNA-binding response OmpR family regulator